MQRKWSVYGPKQHGRKWRIRVRSPQGDWEYLSFATEAEADAAREAALEEISRNDAHGRAAEHFAQGEAALLEAELCGQGRRTVTEAMEAYEVERRTDGRVKRVSLERETYRLRALLGPLGKRSVVQISERVAHARYRARAAEGISPGTHRGELAAARQLWKWLIKKRWVQRNPWQNVEPIGEMPRGKEQLRSIELERVRDHALAVVRKPGAWGGTRSARLGGLAVLLEVFEGLRPLEIVTLEKRDVGKCKLTYRKAKRRLGQVVLATVKVPAFLDELLQDRIAELPDLNSRLFDRKPAWVRRRTQAFCKAAGVTVVSAQGLRGSHASTAVEAGATALDVARQLGHGHTAVTERHYIRADVVTDATAERVAAALVASDGDASPAEDPRALAREIARLQLRLERALEVQPAGQNLAPFLVQPEESQ